MKYYARSSLAFLLRNLWNRQFALMVFISFCAPVYAQSTADIDQGFAWLADQQQSTGEVTSTMDLSLSVQASQETLRAFELSTPSVTIDQVALRDFLVQNNHLSTEMMSRLLLAGISQDSEGQSVSGLLLSLVNSDGGFGQFLSTASAALETGYALQALESASATTDSAVSYLLSGQNPDGGWGFDSSSVFTTAIVLRGLSRFVGSHPQAGTSVNAGRTYLYSQQIGGLTWESDFETAQAVLGLLAIVPNVLELEPTINALMNAQQSNGSWSADTYSTALALQAILLFEAQRDAQQNDTGSVRGRVLIAGSETPVSGASIALLSAPAFEVQTDSAGQFLMDFVPEGAITLLASKPGYLGSTSSLSVSAASISDAGDIFLAIDPAFGLMSGRVFDDQTQSALAGASINLTGPESISGLSGSGGTFEFAALLPGVYSYEISLAGYYGASGVVSVPSGTHARVVQGLVADGTVLTDDPRPVSAQIVDASTQLPIAGAFFELDGLETQLSDANGQVAFDDVSVGDHSAAVSAAGYTTQTLSFLLPPGSSGNLGLIPLYAIDDTEQPSAVTLEATIVDELTDLPIADANLAVFGTALSGVSDENGVVIVEDILVSAFQLQVSAPGYEPRSFDINVSGFGTVAVTLPLNPPEDPTISSSNFSGTILDADTGLAVGGAELRIAAVNLMDTSNVSGEYDLPAISVLEFTIEVTADGYLPAFVPVALMVHGDYAFDIELSPESGERFIVNAVTAPAETVAPRSTILLSADVESLLDEYQDALLIGEIRDASGALISSATPYADGTEIQTSLFSFEPSEAQSVIVPWDTKRHAPGSYVFHLNVVEPGSLSRSLPRGIILATGAAAFTMGSETALGGFAQPNPPLSQAGAATPIQLTAVLRNDGNVPIEAGEYQWSVIDSADDETVLTRLVQADVLDVNQSLTVDFGTWIPEINGQFDVLVQRTEQPEIGSIEGSLLIGDLANADFTVMPSVVPEGNQTVQATIDLTGVDVTTGTSTDPLFALVREAVTRGGAYTGANSKDWHERNRCLGCHIQTQSLEGLSASIGKADINLEDTLYALNVISSSQQPNGGLHISHPQHGKNQTALGLWGMKEWPEQEDVLQTELAALEYLNVRAHGSPSYRYWSTDHYTGWLNNLDAMTAIIAQSAASIVRKFDEGNLQAGPGRAQADATYATAAGTGDPRDIAYHDGWLYIGKNNSSIDRMRPETGQVEVFVSGLSGLSAVSGLDISDDGTVYAGGIGTDLKKILPDGSIESVYMGVSDEYSDIKVAESGDIYVVGRNTNRLLRVSPGGTIEVVASGGLLNQPFGLEMLPDGDLIVSSISGFKLLRVTPTGAVSIYADGFAFPPLRMAWATDGDMYVLSGGFASSNQSTANGINILRANGTIERLGTFSNTQGIALVDDRLFISRRVLNTIQELALVPQSTTIIETFRSSFAGIAQFYLGRYSANDSATLRVAFRLIGLAEARPFVTDALHLAQIDSAIEFVANKLRSRQRADGGWGRYYYSSLSDPLTTAWIGIALDYTNPSPDDPIVRSTVQFLLNQQLADGSWTNQQGYFTTRLSATSLVMTYLPKALERLGGIDIDLQLTSRPDQGYRNFQPAPDSIADNGDNTFTYSWSLPGVTTNGQQIAFDIDLYNMVLDENRPAALDAQLSFANSFTAETVVVPVDIPLVTAISEVSLEITTDKPVYQANEDVDLQSTVSNLKLQFEDGQLALQIVAAGETAPLAVFEDQAIVPLGYAETQVFANQWNTENNLAGAYEVLGQVMDSQGIVVAQDRTAFTIELTGADIDSDLKADRAEYEAWDQVVLNSTVFNPSENGIHEATLAKLELTDPGGLVLLDLQFPVAALNIGDIVTRADGLALVDAPAGQYTATLSVLDASAVNTLSQSMATFLVNRTTLQSLSGQVTASPHIVYQGDPLGCVDTVSNISELTPVQADVIQRLINLDSGTVVQEVFTPVDLAPSVSENLQRDFDSEVLDLGGYSCALFAMVDGEERLLDFDEFAVLEPPINISSEFIQGDHGRVLILLDEPGYFVDEEQCLYIEQVIMSLPDRAVLAEDTQVTVQVLDESGALLESESVSYGNKAVSADEHAGEPNLSVLVRREGEFSYMIASALEINGAYEFIIDIEFDGQVETYSSGLVSIDCELASQFQRTFGDIRIAAMGAQPAVNSDEPFGPADSATQNRQRIFLEGLLTAAGWSYTIVTSAEEFIEQFRSGQYNLYGIFAEKEKLPTAFQGEVREAVYRGEGLVVAGLHDHRDSKMELPLGINATGKHNDALAILLEDSELAPPASAIILLDESVMRVELNGAQAAARFQLGGNADDADIAVSFYDYGQGHSVFGSIDLLVQAVEAGSGSVYEDLILRALELADNPDSSSSAGSAAAYKLTLQNEGVATGGQLVLTLPVGSELLDASPPVNQEGTQFIWPFELAEDELLELNLWLSMPVASGELTSLVQTGVPGDFEDYETISVTLFPEDDVMAAQVFAELDALYLADPGTYHIAWQALERAMGYLDDMDQESALRELLKATLELDGINAEEARAVRLSLARLVRQVAIEFQQQPSP